jgi:hypothetical protein
MYGTHSSWLSTELRQLLLKCCWHRNYCSEYMPIFLTSILATVLRLAIQSFPSRPLSSRKAREEVWDILFLQLTWDHLLHENWCISVRNSSRLVISVHICNAYGFFVLLPAFLFQHEPIEGIIAGISLFQQAQQTMQV